jgi:hypothetical protein
VLEFNLCFMLDAAFHNIAIARNFVTRLIPLEIMTLTFLAGVETNPNLEGGSYPNICRASFWGRMAKGRQNSLQKRDYWKCIGSTMIPISIRFARILMRYAHRKELS